jgi:hypothetical protein
VHLSGPKGFSYIESEASPFSKFILTYSPQCVAASTFASVLWQQAVLSKPKMHTHSKQTMPIF